jgi:hypothetical protein
VSCGPFDASSSFFGRQNGERIDRRNLNRMMMPTSKDWLSFEDGGEPRNSAIVSKASENLDERAARIRSICAQARSEYIE